MNQPNRCFLRFFVDAITQTRDAGDTCAYRAAANRYDHLETALAETLAQYHTPAEVDAVFKHFKLTNPAGGV